MGADRSQLPPHKGTRISFLVFTFFKIYFIIYVYASVYEFVHMSSSVHGDQKRVLDLLELEIEVVVSH